MRNRVGTRWTLAALALATIPAAARAECPHPYMPLRTGATWVYLMSWTGSTPGPVKRILTTRVTSVEVKGDGQVVRMTNTESVSTGKGDDRIVGRSEQVFKCTPDGIVAALEPGVVKRCPGNASTCAEGTQVPSDTEILSNEGVLLPPSVALNPGQSWRQRLSYRVNPPSSALGSPASGLVGSRESTETVATNERITTPAGAMDTVKVTSEETVVVPHLAQATPPGGSQPGRTRKSSSWYARGVGLVRFADDAHTTELLSYTPGF